VPSDRNFTVTVPKEISLYGNVPRYGSGTGKVPRIVPSRVTCSGYQLQRFLNQDRTDIVTVPRDRGGTGTVPTERTGKFSVPSDRIGTATMTSEHTGNGIVPRDR